MPQIDDLADELIELEPQAFKPWSIRSFSGGHVQQLEVIRAARHLRRILLMMARQAAKSWTLCGIFIDRSLRVPGVTSLFLGLTAVALRENFWTKVWKPTLIRYGLLGRVKLNETRMTTEFDNGSRLLMSGTDDLTHVMTFLGNRFAGSVIAIDESQNQPRDALISLLTVIFPPMMTPTTTLLLSGTIPEVPAGVFWDESQNESWNQYSWGRVRIDEAPQDSTSVPWTEGGVTVWISAVNVHTPEAPQVLVQHMKDRHLSLADPQIQRDWFANRKAFDPNARAYHYRDEYNGYNAIVPDWAADFTVPSGDFVCAIPHPGIDTFSGCIDPGAGDPAGVEVWGWDSTRANPEIQQVFSWVSARDHRLGMGAIYRIAGVANQHYRTQQWRQDETAKNELDHISSDYRLPVIKVASKGDMGGQIRRTNDLLEKDVIKCIRNPKNPLLRDYTSAQLDPKALALGQHKWKTTYHPTASENGRYLLDAYWYKEKPKEEKKPVLDPFEEEAQRLYNKQTRYGRKFKR